MTEAELDEAILNFLRDQGAPVPFHELAHQVLSGSSGENELRSRVSRLVAHGYLNEHDQLRFSAVEGQPVLKPVN